MIQIVYESEASASFRAQDLVDIIEIARSANPARHITGMLIFHEGRFVQVIEGPQTNVLELYQHIQSDPRHTDIWRLARLSIEERVFARWSMGLLTKDNMPERLVDSLRDFREVACRLKQAAAANPDGDSAYTARLVRGFLSQFKELETA